MLLTDARGNEEASLECLSKFLKNLVPLETIRRLLVEAEEYVANTVRMKFDFSCSKNLLRDVAVSIIYTPPSVSSIVVEVILTSEIDARDFVTRIYHSLTSKSCYVEVSTEGVYVSREVSCFKALDVELVSVVNSILSEIGENCVLSFSGSYELLWYTVTFNKDRT
ncbi:MAG: hypothetical protein QW154_02830 [Sulfolobales archaeon]